MNVMGSSSNLGRERDISLVQNDQPRLVAHTALSLMDTGVLSGGKAVGA